ncbi:MAG: class I SAM-dependent methyltransferase [Flavobacteriales bacterium]|nr:class I SAM-dependent methyltransferase [Flavobacteriales bacterium]
MKKWFENWFDSKYYHILYKSRNHREAAFFLDNLIQKFEIPLSSSILDLACGKGRHAVHLFDQGMEVTGIDLSKNSIALAKTHEAEGLNFDVHDMRLPYKENHFDYVLNLFTSFGYFEDSNDNLRVLKSARTNLKPNGILIIDYFNSHLVLKNLIHNEKKIIDEIEFSITRKVEDNKVVKQIDIEHNNSNSQFEERVSLFDLKSFEFLFEQSGFSIVDIFGDYQLNRFSEKESPRLILAVQKVKL